MAAPKLSINIPSSPSRRLSDISLSPVRVYDVEQLRLLPPELDAKAHSDPTLAQYLYFTVVAGPDEQAVFEEQTRLWALKTLSLPESFEDTSRLSFAKRLRNGVIACRILHSLWPQLRSDPLPSPSGKQSHNTDSSRQNLETFLDGCESLGIPVATAHSTRDQLRHDILSYTSTRAIVHCLLELSRLAASQGLAVPPPIIAFEVAIDAGDSEQMDSARSLLDQIEGSAPSRTSSPSSSSGSDSDHFRTQRAVSVASSTAASALSRSESEPSTAEGPASTREHRPSRTRRSSSISVQIVSEPDVDSSEPRGLSMSIEVGEASGAASLFANFEAHSTTPLSRQQPEVRRSKWRTIATAPEASQPADVMLVAVNAESQSIVGSDAGDAASLAAEAAPPPALHTEVTPTAQAPRVGNRFFFAELSPRSSLANRLSGGAYARSKWRSIAVHTDTVATTPISQTPAAAPQSRLNHLQAPPPTPLSPSTARLASSGRSGKQEASFDSPEGSKPAPATITAPQDKASDSAPITFLHDYLPVPGDVIDEAVAACFLRNKLRIRPVRLSKGTYLFSSVNRVLRSPRNQAESQSPRLKRASRVFGFGGGQIDPNMLSAFPFPVTPVSNTANPSTGPGVTADADRPVPSSPSVSMSISLSGVDNEGPIAVEAPVRLISGALLVRYDGLWMDLRAFVSHFLSHVSATRKARMLSNLSTAIDTPLIVSPPGGARSSQLSDHGNLAGSAPIDMDEDGGVCETDVIMLEDQLRECFLDTMLPKLAHYDVAKIGHFSSELLFRKAIAEGVSCDRYDEFIEEELGRLTRRGPSRKHGYDTNWQSSPAPHGAKRPHPTPPTATDAPESTPSAQSPAFPGRTQHSQIRQFVKRLLRR